jgi:hypothetical protein
MKLPQIILDAFEKETENLFYGSVSVSYFARGGHIHYELDKHYTITNDEDSEKVQYEGEKND